MRKIVSQRLMIAVVVGLCASVSFAQSGSTPVHFKRGTNTVVLKRTLDAEVGRGNVTFTAYARKGETLYYKVDGAKEVDISLSLPGVQDFETRTDSGVSNKYKVVRTGTHYFTIVNRSGKKAPITFKLKRVNSSHAAAPAQDFKRINWMKEGRHLVWEAEVPAKSSREYVFSARKGQKLSLSFIDDTGVGSLDLGKYSVEPNTDPMKMTIPITKDYTLTAMNNSNKATSFRIGFSLEDK